MAPPADENARRKAKLLERQKKIGSRLNLPSVEKNSDRSEDQVDDPSGIAVLRGKINPQ